MNSSDYSPKNGTVQVQKDKPRSSRRQAGIDVRTPSGKEMKW